MIFTDQIIFLHIGKTGGMSCADYLLHTLEPPIHNCSKDAIAEARATGRNEVLPFNDVDRHCTLSETLRHIRRITGQRLQDFQRVFAVIRHPYTLEYSFYKHLQKPHVRRRRKHNKRLLQLADGDFRTFAAEAELHRRNLTQDAYFRLNGEIPDNVELIRFEQLAQTFPKAVAPFTGGRSYRFCHLGRTTYDEGVEIELTDQVKDLLYRKHRFMFDSGLYSTDPLQRTAHGLDAFAVNLILDRCPSA